MTRSRWWSVLLPALLVATTGPASAAEIRDKAGMFSADAVRKAQSELDRIEKDYQVPVTLETIETLNGKSIDEVLPRHASAIDARGLYILISRKDNKIEADAHKTYAKHLTRPRRVAIRGAFLNDFKKEDFDAGLAKGVEKIEATFSEARAEAGGSLKPVTVAPRRGVAPAPGGRVAVPGKSSWGGSSLIMIVLGILGVLLVVRILGALFSAGRGGYANQGQMMGRGGYPGPGGPGYGGGGYGGAPAGGGGFMSSMFGGIGGALAGNWLYDQFSGGRHNSGGSTDQNVVDSGAAAGGAIGGEPAGPDWVGQGDGGGDWGGGTPTGGDGGGDWGGGGGGGGGDWGGGGGGGGGDWGGGGGGDDGGTW